MDTHFSREDSSPPILSDRDSQHSVREQIVLVGVGQEFETQAWTRDSYCWHTDNTYPLATADVFISALSDASYRLLQPIPVRLEQGEDGEWIASFDAANISMAGRDPKDAQQALADDMVDAFALFLAEEETLGPGPKRQLAVLKQYLQVC